MGVVVLNKVLFLFVFGVFTSLPAYASFACFVSKEADQVLMWNAVPQAMKCSTKANISVGLKGVSLTFQGASLYAACTGVGIPVALYLQGGSFLTSAVEMIVGELECEDTVTEEKIKNMTRDAVCEALVQNGIECAVPALEQQ